MGKLKAKITDEIIDPVYAKYPRKQGKRLGYERLKRLITTEEQWADFSRSVENYAKHAKHHCTSLRYVLLFSTFVNDGRWEDFVEGDPLDDRPDDPWDAL